MFCYCWDCVGFLLEYEGGQSIDGLDLSSVGKSTSVGGNLQCYDLLWFIICEEVFENTFR